MLRDMFPYLWRSSNTSEDIRADLKMTSVELGTKLKRGKESRLAVLRNLEIELEVSALKIKLVDYSGIFELLNELPCRHGSILDIARSAPTNLEEAETVFSISGLFVGQQIRLSEFRSDKCKKLLVGLSLDTIDVSIFRGQICVLNKKNSVIKIAEEYKTSRQSVHERRKRLYKKLITLGATSEFKSLTDFLSRRGQRSGSTFEFDQEDSLVAIHNLQNVENFPTIVDVINTALWLLQESVGEVGLRKTNS